MDVLVKKDLTIGVTFNTLTIQHQVIIFFYPLEVVGRGTQVGKNNWHMYNLNQGICQTS